MSSLRPLPLDPLHRKAANKAPLHPVTLQELDGIQKNTRCTRKRRLRGEKERKKRRRKYSTHQQKLPYCLLLLSDAELAGNLNIHLVASCHMAVMPFTFLITSSPKPHLPEACTHACINTYACFRSVAERAI